MFEAILLLLRSLPCHTSTAATDSAGTPPSTAATGSAGARRWHARASARGGMRLLGNMATNCSKVGRWAPIRGGSSSCKCFSTRFLTWRWEAPKPLLLKALAQRVPFKTFLIARLMCKHTSFAPTTPLRLVTVALWYCSRRLRLYLPKQCVSHGCRSHVNFAGTNSTHIFHLAHARKKRRPK